MEYIRQTVGDSKVLVCEITCYRLLTIYCVILTSPSTTAGRMCNVYMCMGLVQGLAREYTFTSHCHTHTPPHTLIPPHPHIPNSHHLTLTYQTHTTSHPHIPNSHHLTPSHTTSHHLTSSPPRTVTPTVHGEWWGGQCSVYGSSQRSSWGRQGRGRAH